jgi:hypothetical protein
VSAAASATPRNATGSDMSNANKPTGQGDRRERAPAKVQPECARRKPKVPAPTQEGGRFDKAFAVWLDSDQGQTSGIGRNITETGMFVETREPLPVGARVQVTFAAPASPTQLTLEAEVRYQCFLNFARQPDNRTGLRGMGLRFVAGARLSTRGGGTLH